MLQPLLAEFAPAKVNLFLHVVGRRPDGYHVLDSLVVFPGAADRLTAVAAPWLDLAVTGPFAAGLDDGPDNLVLRAARALAESAGVTAGASLVLDKRLPVASGIGGGSADAAAALRLLSRLWSVRLPAEKLREIAAALGADVPVCLDARAGAHGRHRRPSRPRAGAAALRRGPGQSRRRGAPRRRCSRRAPARSPKATSPPGYWQDAVTMARGLSVLSNDLEAPALRLCPAIGDVLAWLRAQPGCLLARMSGSGATCFGLFHDGAVASAVAGDGSPAGLVGLGRGL